MTRTGQRSNVTRQRDSKTRKAEEDLSAALRMWHTTFEAIDDGIFILDREHRILRCNEATGRITRLTG